jgi:alanine racemase
MPASQKLHTHNISGQRPTWAEIDLNALAANFHLIKRYVGARINVMAVVKANAYGHGAVACARRLAAEGADWFGVALPEEGIELRESGITQPILCLGGFWEGQAEVCVKYRLTPVIYRVEMMEALDGVARASGETVNVHLKIDTGMGRLGFRFDALSDALALLKRFENLRVDGLMTHFAAADDPGCEALTEDQITRFAAAVSAFRQAGHQPAFLHSANSAAIYSHSDSWGNMIRPGGVLYGLWRDVLPATVDAAELQPVMSLHSQISLLKWVPAGETIGYGCTFEASRKTLVATIPIGYDDGYPRALSNRAHVVVRGVCASVVGRVSMDLTLVDVTGVPGVALGDPVMLLGRDNAAGLSITAEELAKIAGTLSYEITCGIGKRVPRIVRHSG